MMKRQILILCLALCTAAQAQTTALETFLAQPALRYAGTGVYVKNMQTGEVIADWHSDQLLTPASTQKLLTSATALELLGSSFRFSTYVETDGEVREGVLHGNLYIRGTGDPTLGSQKVGDQMFLYKWVQALRRAGISRIEGSVVADASFFDGDALNPQWLWEDIGNYYAPGIYALPYLDNTLNIQLRSAAVGSVAEVVKTLPYIEGLEYENHIRCTTITYDGAYVHGVPYSNRRYLVGSIPSNHGIFGVKGDIPNPPLLLAQHLTQRLRESGITVTGEADYLTESLYPQRHVLYEHRSEPLAEIVRELNVNSNNLYAEQLFRYLGSRMGVPCTIQGSVDVLRNCWRNRGVDIHNSLIMDGCGLSPNDGVSAQTLVQLLSFMLHSRERDAFVGSLPVAGESGTLQGFLAKTELQGRVTAKSGTTSRVKSYAGYITLDDGMLLGFAVIVNNAACKPRGVQTLIERLLRGICSEQKEKQKEQP